MNRNGNSIVEVLLAIAVGAVSVLLAAQLLVSRGESLFGHPDAP